MRFSLRRIVFLPAIVLLVSQFALAQGNPSPAGMAFVDGAPADFAWIDSAGATVIGVPGDDNEIYPINLPFDFWYYNDLYTANTPLTVSSNGWISFDAGLSGSVSFNINLDLVDGADFVTLVGPFWDNWLLNPNSQISYKTIGLAPYRRLVISYSNVVKSSNPSEGPVSFQVILSETANTIKFQYLRDYVSDVERGSLGTVGVHFDDTNGGGSIDDYAQFLYESTLLQNNLAIQFFASDQLTANASFNPSTGTAGTGNQSFELTVSNIDLQSNPNVENMGKADVLRIANGFGSDALSVTGVTVDGTSFFVNNSTTPPTQAQTNVLGNLATWYYDSGTDSLFIQVANAAISDEIVVRFTANVPQTAGSYTFNGDVYTRLNVGGGATISPAITVNPVGVAAYTVTPAGDFTAVVGNPVNLVLRAQDQFGNPVANSQTVDVAALGGDQVFVNSAEAPTSLSFAGEDSIAVTVETFVAQDFTLRFSNQVGGTPTIQSGQLTFLPDVPNKFDKVAGDSANIFVSRSLDLKVFLKDQYGNPVADSTVTFAVNPGNGGSVSPLTDITLATGEAETRFTAPATPDTSIITVSAGAALDSFIVYTLGEIAYFLVEPTNFTPIAGQTFSVTVTAYDIHNNQVTSDNSTIVNLTSDGTGVTMPASGQLSSGEVTFTNAVSNTVAENFRITATSQGDPSKTGTSGLIRVSPAAATTVVKVSGDTTGIFAGNNQKLSVEVQDNFGNTVSGATVNFVVTGGGGDLSADIATSNASGIAESILTTGATAGTNTVTAQVGAFPLVTFTVTTVAGGISYFEVTPAVTSTTAGTAVSVTATAFDVNGNQLVNDNSTQVVLSSDGTTVSFNPASPVTLSGGAVTFDATNNTAESYRITVARQNAPNKTGTSVPITVSAGNPANLIKFANLDNQSAPVGTQLPLDIEVQVTDVFNNPVSGATVAFSVDLGNGSVSVDTATTTASGVASTAWTLGDDTGSDDVLTADVVGFATTPNSVTYSATPTAGGANNLTIVGSATQSGEVNTLLPTPFTVLVTDGSGNPVPNQPVSFVLTSVPTGATDAFLDFNGDPILTDANGEAGVQLHLGTKVGNYIVRAFTGVTTPNFVTFTGTGTVAAPAAIQITSGNNQSGTINAQLAQPIVFTVVDAYENVVQGEQVDFSTANGSLNPTFDISDAAGEVSTLWTLGATAGAQQMSAALNSNPLITSGTVSATGTAGAAATLTLNSIRGVSGNDIPVLGNEMVSFVLSVRDVGNNPVSGASITFSGASDPSVLFESNPVTTGSDGTVTARVRTAQGQNATSFTATVSGVTPVVVNMPHVRYVAGTLSPGSATPGINETFSLDVRNFSLIPVSLNTSGTTFSFSDGIRTYQATLSGPATLAANSATTLTFNSVAIDPDFATGAYDPMIFFQGSGGDAQFNGDLTLPTGSLVLAAVEITQITTSNTDVLRGQTITVTMQVSNTSPSEIQVDSLSLSAVGIPQGNIVPDVLNPATIPGSGSANFDFDVTIPAAGAETQYDVTGFFRGILTANGAFVSDATSPTLVLTVLSSANIAINSLSPLTVTSGTAITFTAAASNGGSADLVLTTASTLSFGTDVLTLKQGVIIPGGGSAELDFESSAITSTANQTAYPADIRLVGSENGVAYDNTFSGAANILVQSFPDFDLVPPLVAVPTQVSQGQSGVIVNVQIRNNGATSAPAVISQASNWYLTTALDSAAMGEIRPATVNGSAPSYPITVNAGQTLDLTFSYAIPVSYPTGTETVRFRYTYGGANSDSISVQKPNNFDTYDVLSRANLAVGAGSPTLTPDTVTAGQQNVALSFVLENIGQTNATIASAGAIGIDFLNNHTVTLTSPTFPVTISGGSTRTFTYDVDVAANATAGNDPYDLSVTYSDALSSQSYQLLAPELDTLRIVNGATTSNVQILSVVVPAAEAVRGQSGLPATLRLQNLSGVSVRVDALALTFSGTGLSGILQNTLPVTLGPGTAQNFDFLINVGAAATLGNITVDGNYQVTDLVSNNPVSGSGAVTTDILAVRIPATAFTINNISVVPNTVSPGQNGITFRANVINGTSQTAIARVTDLTLNTDFGTFTATRVAPATLPLLLPGGQSVQVEYNLDIDPGSALGVANLALFAAGEDTVNGDLPFSTTSASVAMTIQDSAALSITNVNPPDSVYVGQSGIAITATVQNTGQNNAQVTSVSLSGLTGYTVALQQPTGLPSTLTPGGSVTVTFLVGVPSNINPGSGLVQSFDISASGVDVATSASISASASPAGSFVVVTPANVAFSDLLDPGPFQTGTTADIRLEVLNSGGATLILDSTTELVLEKEGDPATFITVPVDPGTSGMRIAPGATSILRFFDGTTTLSGAGTYRVISNLYGSAFGDDYSQRLDTQSFIVVGSDIAIVSLLTDPNPVEAGQDSVRITAVISNTGAPVTIDTLGLKPTFIYSGGGTFEPLNLVRVDTLSRVVNSASLIWQFAIPDPVQPGLINTNIEIAFNGGQIGPLSRAGSFTISSGINISYVDGSLTPDSVSQGETVTFQADFINEGSANYFLDNTTSFVEIFDGVSQTFTANIAGNLAIPGTPAGQTAVPTTLTFVATAFPADFDEGLKNARFVLDGELPDGTSQTGLDATFPDQVTVLQGANFTVNDIDVVPDRVLRGQEDVTVNYTFENTGGVPITVTGVTSTFFNALGDPVDGSWFTQSSSPSVPFVLNPNVPVVFTRDFIVDAALPPGVVTARVEVDYTAAGQNLTFSELNPSDPVTVVTPSEAAVSGLDLVNVPNAANQRVNTGQGYDLALTLSNSGGDTLTNVNIRIVNEAGTPTTLLNQNVGALFPGADSTYVLSLTAPLTAQNLQLRASITSATSATDGSAADIGTSGDDIETVIVDTPSALALTAVGPANVLVGQVFAVDYEISRTGSSPFDNGEVTLNLPGGFVLDPGTQSLAQAFSQSDLDGQWTVRATTATASAQLAVIFSGIPNDLNTANPLNTTGSPQTIAIAAADSGMISAAVNITAPAGAIDGTVSTGQTFTIENQYTFTPNVLSNSRRTTIELPTGYALESGSATTSLAGSDNGTVTWIVRAPASAQGANDITVRTLGTDATSGDPVEKVDILTVTTEARSALTFTAVIASPAGAQDRIVSTFQSFDLQLGLNRVANTAPLVNGDSTAVVLDFTASGFYFDNQFNDEVRTISLLPDQSRTVTVFAGPTAGAGRLISAVLSGISLDSNSGEAATVNADSLGFLMQIVNRANLAVDLQGSTILGQGDTFQLTGVVRNTGTAGITPNTVQMDLTYDTNLFTLLSGNASTNLPVGTEVTYTFDAPSGPSTGNDFILTIANSSNNDVNTGAPAFVSRDSSTLTIDVVDAELRVNNFTVASPQGAVDNIVSTRQNFVVQASYFFNTTIDQDRKIRLSIPDSSWTTADTNFIALSNASGVQRWTVTAPDSATAARNFQVILSGVRGSNGQTLTDDAFLSITTVERTALSLNASFTAPDGALDGVLSTGQAFDFTFVVANEGTALANGNNRVGVNLPAGYTFSDGLSQKTFSLLTGTPSTQRVLAPAVPATISNIALTLITAAQDTNTNAPATVLNSNRDLPVRTVERALLSVAIQSDSVFSAGQTNIPVTVNLSNAGVAAMSDGTADVRLSTRNALFTLASGEPDTKTVPITNQAGSVQFLVDAPASGITGPDTFEVAIIATNIADENNNYPDTLVAIAPPATRVVAATMGGSVVIDTLLITGPAGAQDDTLSTGQTFRLKSTIRFVDNIANSGRSGEVVLPAGFSLASGDTAIKPLSGDSVDVFWNVVVSENILSKLDESAPGVSPAQSRSGQLTSLINGASPVKNGDQTPNPEADFTLSVFGRGVDQASGATLQQQRDLPITVVERLSLAVETEIIAPTGAEDNVISTGQPFEVRVFVRNDGEAGALDSTSTVEFTVPPTFSLEGGGQTVTIPLSLGPDSAKTIRVVAPASVPTGPQVIKAQITQAATDENSGQPALLTGAVGQFNVAVVNRADVALQSFSPNLPTVVREQDFSVRGTVANLGQAGIEPQDSVQLRLIYSQANFELVSPSDTVSVVLDTNQPKPFSWNLRVQPGIDLGTYPITVEVLTGLSWDANSYPDSAVWSSVPELEATVTVAELGALAIQQPVILPADTNRALVVTNQNIVVRVPTSVDPTFDERELVLYLPDVFSSDSVSSVVPTGSGVITFPLTVPDTLPGQIQRFDVVLRARSSLDSTLVTDTDSLFMDIRRNASLTLGGRILGINGTTVSGGQAFRYGALVSNSGSSLSSNGEVTLSLGPGLNFSGGSQAVQTFIPGDSLFWNVTAASNSQAEKLAGQISELREQKRVLFSQMARGNRVDEGSGSNQQELSRLGGEIDGLYEALGKLAVPSFLNAVITRVPLDSISGAPAAVLVDSVSSTVNIDEAPYMDPPALIYRTGNWSTGQSGLFQLTVNAPSNVINRVATVRFVDTGFSAVDSSKSFTGDAVSFTLTAPDSVVQNGTQDDYTLRFVITGEDRNNPGTLVRDSSEVILTVQQRSQLRLRVTGNSLSLSRGEPFTISASLSKPGASPISGNSRVQLVSSNPNFTFTSPEIVEVTPGNYPASLQWSLTAPEERVTSALFTVRVLDPRPVDANSGQTLTFIDGISSQPIFASLVNTELEVEIVPFDSISYNFAQGATNVALFMLRFTNLSNSDSIIVNGLTLSAREAEGLNNTVPDITNLISRFRAVSKAFYEAGLSKIQTPDELGNLPLSADTNPVAFNYSNLDRLGPGEVSEVVLLMDLANLQINRSFKVRVDDVAAIDGQGRNVDVIDPNGAEFRSQGAQFQSPLAITILSREGKDSFFNYPNPFGMDTQILNPPTERGNTRFVFVPKSEPASGELRIYTLTGGLVTRIEKSLDGFQADQAYSRPFVWNGLNDDGERVVNGVYVAVLRITYRDGSTDRFETKVAYIK